MNEAVRNAFRTGVILLGFTVLGTALLAFTFDRTKDIIARSQEDAKRALINQALPPTLYDNDILADRVVLPPNPELGTRRPSHAYRARLAGQPSAVVLEAVAPDGYSGDIHLLIAIRANGELAGVRVTAHRETPGLGDYIDAARSDWIRQFDGASLARERDDAWQVKKDGGRFDYMTGATISARAVVRAVHKALRYYQREGAALLLAPAATETTS